MSTGDKIRNRTQDLKGKAKEAVGNLTGDEEMAAEGKADQSKADAKQAGENLKDAARRVTGN